ncbi:hypothetical protein PIB30_063989 [Stylosanthes scabra]|uniref:F-box domain-containing protein n=1 Tax=Stylosanthes scabra TaxID=79078 RepID=A0ABU6UL63_9FABA|nr:hypothetical protein [Stylosanthes scabra]
MKVHGNGVVERCNLICPTLPVLPDDIVIEILLSLPVKALLQFKCVCKSWRILISSPEFAMENFRQHSSADGHLPSRLVYANKSYYQCRFGFLPLQPLFKNPSATTQVISFEMGYLGLIFIRGSCNGLLCLHHLQSRCFCLWNPCTRAASKWVRIEFASDLTYGFGYDHVHDKYKLVTAHKQYLTRIFTFGANSWTFGPNFPYPPVSLSGNTGKFLSVTGTLNWMAKMKEKNWVILSFDLTNETFRQVLLPRLSGGGNNTSDPELQILRNSLCFAIHHKDTGFEVWMMKEYGVWESWMMISRIDAWFHYLDYPLTPLSISEHGVLLLMLPDRRLVMYDSDDGLRIDSSSDALLLHNRICTKGIFLGTFFVYHDSLVSPPQ